MFYIREVTIVDGRQLNMGEEEGHPKVQKYKKFEANRTNHMDLQEKFPNFSKEAGHGVPTK